MKELDDRIINGLRDLRGRIDTILEDYEKELPSKFEVGKWYCYKEYIFRVLHVESQYVYMDNNCSKLDGSHIYVFGIGSVWYNDSRHATKEEIEANLKKICDKRYIGKKVRCLVDNEDIKRIECFEKYNYDDDSIVYNDKDGRNIYIYKQGKFECWMKFAGDLDKPTHMWLGKRGFPFYKICSQESVFGLNKRTNRVHFAMRDERTKAWIIKFGSFFEDMARKAEKSDKAWRGYCQPSINTWK